MRHLDLFSGIGTWALASKEVWPEREMVGFCEIDPFCREILAKHFPDTMIYEDVKTITFAPHPNRGGLQGSGAELETTGNGQPNQAYELDLLTASPPCQAASAAGKRKGTTDDRWLWPWTFRVLSETRPRWFIFENVRGILSLEGGVVFDALISEMEGHNYEVWPVVIPASGVGAPHRRERVWIVGRRKDDAQDPISIGGGGGREDGGQVLERRGSEVQIAGPDSETREGDSSDPKSRRERTVATGDYGRQPETPFGNGSGIIANPQSEQSRRLFQPELQPHPRLSDRSDWKRDWQSVAYETCWEDAPKPGDDRMDDGTQARVYGPRKLPEAPHRKERLKACGNGIVGQVAVEIMKAIRSSE